MTKTFKMTCHAKTKISLHGHQCSLTKVLVGHSNDSQGSKVSSNGYQRLIRLGGSYYWFCHVLTQISHQIHVYAAKMLRCRVQPRAFRQGEVLQHFQDFREKFWSKFWVSLYVLYIFTSPSAQNREKSASSGRLFLPTHPLG